MLAAFAAVLLIVSRGDTQALVPLFAIGVFIGFTLSQVGMVRHWSEQRGDGWWWRATINGVGAVLTFAAVIIELVSKFTEGAWIVVIVIPLLIAAFMGIHRAYRRIGQLLGLGTLPPPPHRQRATIVVPVGGLSRLTAESITAALALGDQVTAVYVCYGDEEDEQTRRFQQAWEQWDHQVPLVTLYSPHRSLGRPIVDYLHQLEQRGDGRRLVVLISELEPTRPWQWILHNQRGLVLDRAIRNGTDNVVICRMRFRPTTWSAN